jgi:hypothetical protein
LESTLWRVMGSLKAVLQPYAGLGNEGLTEH